MYKRPSRDSVQQCGADLGRGFEGDLKLRFNVAGGPFGRRDPATGRLQKREVGAWLMTVFRIMAPLRRLRGSVLDPFRHGAERRLAHDLLARYEDDLERLGRELTPDNHALAVQIAAWPDRVRGYGHVREAHAERVAKEREALFAQWSAIRSPERQVEAVSPR